MCGRFTLTVSARVLADLFAVEQVPELAPRYNVAPTQRIPIVRAAAGGGREVVMARWGLIPFWAKDEKMGARMINARAETAASKPAFRAALRERRCLIPADGFYEWRTTDGGKQPHLVRFADGRPFAFAGLWERWRPARDADPLDSCTILTTSPNELVRDLHDRMPVILARERFGQWLAPASLSESDLAALLGPCPPEGMEAVRVSRHVNSPSNDDPECVRPLAT